MLKKMLLFYAAFLIFLSSRVDPNNLVCQIPRNRIFQFLLLIVVGRLPSPNSAPPCVISGKLLHIISFSQVTHFFFLFFTLLFLFCLFLMVHVSFFTEKLFWHVGITSSSKSIFYLAYSRE